MSYAIPSTSLLTNSDHQYADCFSIKLEKDPGILEITKAIFLSTPGWIKSLMSLRNRLVQRWLKTSQAPIDPEQIIRNFEIT